MRRPSPLPQPPVASRGQARAGAPTPPADDHTAGDDWAGVAPADDYSIEDRPVEDHPTEDLSVLREAGPRATESARETQAGSTNSALTDGNDTAPVIPLSSPTALPSAAPAPDSGRAPGSAAKTDAGDVGFREVWRASRARRKALRAEIRRFTVRQRRRRAIWLGAAASVLLLALGTLGAAYSPLFGVERISVVGAQQLAADDISDALATQLGTPLPLVDESAVKAALVAFPLIETYALEARPPHELVVRIVERTPIGLIETRAGYTLVDAAGVALSTAATPSAGMPVLAIAGGIDSDAFAAAGQVMRALPDDIRAQVTEVTASTPDDVTLTLGGSNAQVVWGSADRSADKALNLAKMMAQRPPADVTTYDVTSPEVVVVR
ncbi:cell division protein [Microbacterium sp. B35-04]|uniref:FtsQ-type POTRA domain-containing protein n=1 Tax=Microbacterium sp. B35-04 TaxID=1961716 RepID=UPI0013D3808B|nr:FtsQ-type POTRA domain-containing protein [Microbacterium sp. B35-04]KAF2413681.1 cell division protein [Microbacterium sp. B35-04]